VGVMYCCMCIVSAAQHVQGWFPVMAYCAPCVFFSLVIMTASCGGLKGLESDLPQDIHRCLPLNTSVMVFYSVAIVKLALPRRLNTACGLDWPSYEQLQEVAATQFDGSLKRFSSSIICCHTKCSLVAL
jgi:hypothetical protein